MIQPSSKEKRDCHGEPLPQFVRDLLASPPARGGGLNNWFFRVARHLHAFRTDDEIILLLSAATEGAPVKHGEIERAVENSRAAVWQPGQSGSTRSSARWPALNREQSEAIIHDSGGLVDLWEVSPVRLDDNKGCTEAIVDRLFPGNPLLCVGRSNSQFATRHRESLRGQLAAKQFIVPSQMSARTGTTQEGKVSEHSLDNTGPRRFLVVEFDQGTADEHAAILLHLAERAPLALAVHSGGKSLHGWFYCSGRPEERLHDFMRYTVMLGADPATWTRSQFVRMPDGLRDNGKRQTVYFFNSEVVQ